MTQDAGSTNPKRPPVDWLSELWRHVRDHKIAQWSVAYIAVAYALQQGVVLTSQAFEWPEAVLRVSMLLLILGLPVVMTLAWYHGERASRHFSAAELTIISLLLVIGSVIFYTFVQPQAEVADGPQAVQQQGVELARAAPAAQASGISLAVLPFANLSSDPEQEFFSDGMTEEITTALAKISDLRVVGRTSAFQFKGEKKDLRAIGQALLATHLLEGSVRKDGNRLRITAQLIKAEDGTHIWTENYDRELTGVFAIQEDIATAIAGALRTPLGLRPGGRLIPNRSIDPDSYEQYLRAKALVRARGAKPLADSAVLLEQIVARDPDFAPAWALLALAYGLMPIYGTAVGTDAVDELRRLADSYLPKADTAARRAIQLDPNFADGYLSLANVQGARGKWIDAVDLISKAVSLDPTNTDILRDYGNILAEVGRLKEALEVYQRALALEPFAPAFKVNTATQLYLNGKNEAAIELLKALPPGNGVLLLTRIYAAMGRYDDAAAALTAVPPGNYPSGVLEAAVRLLRMAPTPAASPQALPWLGNMEFVYVYIGAHQRALERYEARLEVGFAGVHWLLWDPSYSPVWKTERFKAYARKAGLVEYWRARGWPEFCRPVGADDFACD